MSFAKHLVTRTLRAARLHRSRGEVAPIEPVEFSKKDVAVLRYVLDNELTMASPQRVIATINACKHAIVANIPGDFVECGVWRGGNSIAAKLIFEEYGSARHVWLFDTFAGMTAPSPADTTQFSSMSAADRFKEGKGATHNSWCYASLDDVKSNFVRSGADLSGVTFVAGDVSVTLTDESNLPSEISVLRLDTDFYDSTRSEMRTLYPRLTIGGTLLIDDFGHWDGARRAVEEYFATMQPDRRPLLHFTDYTGRMATKVKQSAS